MGLRGRDDPIPQGERCFILASIKKALEDGDTPVKVKNLVKQKKKSES